jgi:hypothetical protein
MKDEPGDLIRSQMLPTREQLQLGQINHHQPVYLTIAEKFNDWSTSSGGLIEPRDDVLLNQEINPDRMNRSDKITPQKVFELFTECRKKYATACSKFYQATGVHDEKFFLSYCEKDVDVYYLFLTIKSFQSEALDSFCREGYEIAGGFDSARSSLTTASDSPSQAETKSQSRVKATMAATLSIVKSLEKALKTTEPSTKLLRRKISCRRLQLCQRKLEKSKTKSRISKMKKTMTLPND